MKNKELAGGKVAVSLDLMDPVTGFFFIENRCVI